MNFKQVPEPIGIIRGEYKLSDLPITEQEVNHLMEAPKSIIEEIRWTSKPGREHILEFVVPPESVIIN